MRFDDLAFLFVCWGWVIKPHHYHAFETYLKSMLERKRVMIIQDEGTIVAIITFFITDTYDTLYKKDLWDTPEDNPHGHQIYIDKMVCKKVTLDIRRKIQEEIESNFPEVVEGYYHRAPYDRCVKIWRKGTKHEKLPVALSG